MICERLFTADWTEGTKVRDKIPPNIRPVKVTEDEKVIFEMDEVEAPKSWSDLAVKVVASKYLWKGKNPEISAYAMVERVAAVISLAGRKMGYFDNDEEELAFKDELSHICLNQHASFNSPVWFNCGITHEMSKGTNTEEHEAMRWRYAADLGKIGKIVPVQPIEEPNYPLLSACFIIGVKDTLEHIFHNALVEAMIFKNGAGVGANRSNIRSSIEYLSGGGKPSGPLSYMQIYDVAARFILSGGRVRRAAKMEILDADHGDIFHFARCKLIEERKAGALIKAGYSAGMNGEAYRSVMFQNANHSISVKDEFWKIYEHNKSKDKQDWRMYNTVSRTTGEKLFEYNPEELVDAAVQSTLECGDPGWFFHDTVNRFNTCKNSGIIRSSNPCVTGDTLIPTNKGLIRIDELSASDKKFKTINKNMHEVDAVAFPTGTKQTVIINTWHGETIKCTHDHRIYINREDKDQWCEASDLHKDDLIHIQSKPMKYRGTTPQSTYFDTNDNRFWFMLGWIIGDGWISTKRNSQSKYRNQELEAPWATVGMCFGIDDDNILHNMKKYLSENNKKYVYIESQKGSIGKSPRYIHIRDKFRNEIEDVFGAHGYKAHYKEIPTSVFMATTAAQLAFLDGLISSDGTINYRPGKDINLRISSSSIKLLQQSQVLLLNHGILSKIYNRGGKTNTFTNKPSVLYELIVNGKSLRKLKLILPKLSSDKKNKKYQSIPNSFDNYGHDRFHTKVVSVTKGEIEEVYDINVDDDTHSFVANGMIIHNCVEYMNIDDSSCNLASINVVNCLDVDGKFDIKKFQHICKIVIIAQDIIVDMSSYPTKEITINTHRYRPLGLGYANIGSLIMHYGYGYDSHEGRALAGAITSLMTATAYLQSSVIAERMGAFEGFEVNHDCMLDVIDIHMSHNEVLSNLLAIHDTNGCIRRLCDVAGKTWETVKSRGQQFGFRNSQTTNIPPTGCLVSDSLIATEQGLIQLGTIGDTDSDRWQNINMRVMTDTGIKKANKFYVNGQDNTLIVKTESGHKIQGTHKHKIKILVNGEPKWTKLDEIKNGDMVPIMLDQYVGHPRVVALPPTPEVCWTPDKNFRAPRVMSKELAELIGYYMGDGSIHTKGLRFCVDTKDADVVERIKHLVRSQFNMEGLVLTEKGDNYTSIYVNSIRLTMWWELCGFCKVHEEFADGFKNRPRIPDAVLYSNDRDIYCAFLRGLYESDGTACTKVPSIATVWEKFADEISSMLLYLGYPTHSRFDVPTWQKFGRRSTHNVRIKSNYFVKKWIKEIGFIGKRKTKSLKCGKTSNYDTIPITKRILDNIPDEFYNAAYISFNRRGTIARSLADKVIKINNDKELKSLLRFAYDIVSSVCDGGLQPTYDLSVPDNLTYIANGFVSHNTISFMMDCDTTGIEPEIMLLKVKELAGGGTIEICNKAIPTVLKKLGYDDALITAAVAEIKKTGNFDEINLKEEHLNVFQCSYPIGKRIKPLPWKAHVKMMAAVQPFLSGAISKTINMSKGTKAEDIKEAVHYAWKKGLKSIAFFVDGSKNSSAPIKSKEDAEKNKERQFDITDIPKFENLLDANGDSRAIRKPVPDTRPSVSHKISIDKLHGYIHVGFYPDTNEICEIFTTVDKEGTFVAGILDCWCIAISYALQYGCPFKKLYDKFKFQNFEPRGFVGQNKLVDSPYAYSLVDYIFRWIEFHYPGGKLQHHFDPRSKGEQPAEVLKTKPDEKVKPIIEEGFIITRCSKCNSTNTAKSGCGYVCQTCGYEHRADCGGSMI